MSEARVPPSELPPQIGRFTVLSTLGRGGMGVVYTAYDPELDRKVALKLVHLGGDPEHLALARERLLHEAQTMARLSHPNVVGVYEVGTVDDQVFLAMEYVRGESLRTWLRTPRPWREILAVFMQAGAGLAAAHKAGIVHRDFKPDNTVVDREGRARVVDFGLAEHRDEIALRDSNIRNAGPDTSASVNMRLAVGLQELSPGTLSTMHRTGGRLVGTPAYMAPEQHLGGTADARADQFSFCAALYEALYGERPFPGATLGELRMNLVAGRMHTPPPRSPVPPWLRRVLVRGLASDPDRRHPDMPALLAALAHDPRVTLRRRLLVAGLLLAILAALAAGYASRQLQEDQHAVALAERRATCEAAGDALGEVWDEPRRAAAEQALLATGLPYAADTWARARARLDAAAQGWKDMSVETCLSAQVHGTLAPAAFERRMACLQRQRAELDGLTRTLATADARVAERAVQASATLPRPAACADADTDTLADPASRGETEALRQSLARANAQLAAGRYAEASAEARRIAEAARAHGELGLTAEALHRAGMCDEAAGDFKGAAATLGDAFFLAEQAGRDPLRAEIATSLATVLGVRLARADDGLAWLRHARAIVERVGLTGQPRVALLAAESALLRAKGELERAGELAAQTLAMLAQLHGGDDVRVARAELNVGTNFFDRGDYPRADQHYQRALALFEQNLGLVHPDLAPPLNNLATVAEKLGRSADAERAHARSIAIREASFGERHPGVGISLTNLGELYARTGDPVRAEASFRRAAEIFEAVLGPDHPNLASALGGLGHALVAQGRLAEARPLHARAQAILERALGPDHILIAFPQVDLATLELAADNPAAAIAPATRALVLRAAGKPEERAEAALVLSRALWRSARDKPRARQLAAQAETDYAAAGPGFVKEHAEAASWRSSLSAP
ncbi:MAG: serine/threonine protein kinase [Nannocystis sp.]|uniref:serine/threonine-protein kinase n=1 Tax=Nannocystis sp. TaxID=1962667 RepID=UPI0024295429|nr:serine/threonine-protein kinase [Nannocystis sp.]MBK9752087.1 serine/threonine protein kinase [Nannocystis sp.]